MSDTNIERFKLQTPAEIIQEWEKIPQEQKDAQEREYRRGYRDGWVQAIDALHDLMFQEHASREEAYYLAWEHWEGALLEWEMRAQTKPHFEIPPTELTRKPKE